MVGAPVVLVMSVRWSEVVWEESQAEGRILLVALALADHANIDGVCWPTLRGLAAKARCTKQTVVEAVRWLEEHHELRVHRGGGRNRRSRYLLFPDRYPNGLANRPRKRSIGVTPKRSTVDRNGLPLSGATRPHTPNRHIEPSRETVRDETDSRQKRVPVSALLTGLQGGGDRAPRTGWCQDYREHQLQHRLVNGGWRCEVCRGDPDHAEPPAEMVASEWSFEEGSA